MKYAPNCSVRRLSPPTGDYFFGYYDLPAFSASGKLHLAHRADFIHRLQTGSDSVELGLIETNTGVYHALERTCAWNFQQGAMLQWNPRDPEHEIIYNTVLDGEYAGVVMDIRTGRKRYLEKPVANVSRDGKWGLSVNFSRLYHFRPGYGYAALPDPFFHENHAREDGIHLIDMETGKAKLIISMEEIWDFSGKWFGSDRKMNINHITFNPDASRFLFLARNFRVDERPHRTALITANRDGSGMFLLSDYGVISHYHWRDPEHLLLYADGKELACREGEYNNYIIRDLCWEGELLHPTLFRNDNHMSYSPDLRYILWDSYPDRQRMQQLNIFDTETGENTFLGKFYSMEFPEIDIRCDLHPRWDRTGTRISFDSTHEGRRGIYLIEDLPGGAL